MGDVASRRNGGISEPTENDSILINGKENFRPSHHQESGNVEEERPRGCWSAIAGAFFALIGGLSLGSVDVFVVFGVEGGIFPLQQLLVKSIIMVIVVVPLMRYHSVNLLKVKRKDIILNILKGIFEAANTLCFNYSLVYIGIGDATTIDIGSIPIMTTLLACLFLSEKCKVTDMIITIINLTGILLVSRPEFVFGTETSHKENDSLGYLLAFAAAVTLSLGALFTKMMSDGTSLLLILLFNGISGIVVTAPTSYFFSPMTLLAAFQNNPNNVGFLTGMAGFFILYLYTFNKALQLETAAKVTLIFNIQVFTGFIADTFLFGKIPTHFELIGAALVLFSSLLAFLAAFRENRTESKDVETNEALSK
ncbi:solute carrier family 35 member G1-like [Ptychodera flava]|uniref:solute carrier family 35 member G1-like n=1 Tax=Ptychodera flava TaxID=63121 RepID=UPI003969D359